MSATPSCRSRDGSGGRERSVVEDPRIQSFPGRVCCDGGMTSEAGPGACPAPLDASPPHEDGQLQQVGSPSLAGETTAAPTAILQVFPVAPECVAVAAQPVPDTVEIPTVTPAEG